MNIWRNTMILLMESVAETSEEFMDRYFEGDEFSVTEVSRSSCSECTATQASFRYAWVPADQSAWCIATFLMISVGYFPSPRQNVPATVFPRRPTKSLRQIMILQKQNLHMYGRQSRIRSSANILSSRLHPVLSRSDDTLL